ncbi:hypothetical protein [Micromonospora echinofusca]|uniref:Uncharacterized protein n=1 Tax=Micromonospora echinofusca TaxID=47858 RepID=A0ABS3VJM0_MICEH|nr:hypothetical protein [Micromonospora echinofusca]MBO4204720.1 hypothetical protein [Micromonospora echinofusca]
MAHRSWGRPLPVAFAVALLTGSAQLGVGYGLGLLRLPPRLTGLTTDQWATQLTWAAWVALVATVTGALVGGRRATGAGPDRVDDPTGADPDRPAPTGRTDRGRRVARQLLGCAMAAVGALVVLPFAAFPARAVSVGALGPVAAVGLAVGVAVAFGMLVAVAALHFRPVRRNVLLLTAVLWVLAVAAVVPALGPTDPLPQVRLGAPGPGLAWLPDPLVVPILALLAGILVGLLARREGDRSLWAGGAGAVGPAMYAVSQLVAGVGAGHQPTPYWPVLVAVGSGALGSALAVLWRWPLVTRPTRSAAIEPTDILAPLPRSASGPEVPGPGYDGEVTDVETVGEPALEQPVVPAPALEQPVVPAPAPVPAAAPAPAPEPAPAPTPEPAPGLEAERAAGTDGKTAGAVGTEAETAGGTTAETETAEGVTAGAGTAADAEPAGPPSDGRPRSGRWRRGLFRRDRAEPGPAAPDDVPPSATPDDEYVDWVSRLSRPVPDPAPRRDEHIPRRTLRSPGRHHAD